MRELTSTVSTSPMSPSPRKRPSKRAERDQEEDGSKKAKNQSAKKVTTPTSKRAQSKSPSKTKQTSDKEKPMEKVSSDEDTITINRSELLSNLMSNKRFMDLLEKVAFDFISDKISQEGEREIPIERADTSKNLEEHESPSTSGSISGESKASTQTGQTEGHLPTFDEIGRMIVNDAQVKSAMQHDVIMALISKNPKKYTPKRK